MKSQIIFLFALVFLGSCAKRILMSDHDIRKHYQNSCSAPHFESYHVGERTIHFAESGNDSMPLILFVHGAPGGWYGYMKYLDDSVLCRKLHMISVDRPGYGKSDYGKSLVSIEEQAKLIEPIIRNKSHGRPVVIVGRSYGGPVAIELAMKYPKEVNALLLIAPAIDPDHEKYFWFNKPANSKLIRWLLPDAFNVASDEKFRHPSELRKMDSLWNNISVPSTVMQGSDDHIVDTINFSFMKEHLHHRDDRFYFYKGYSHFIAAEHPEVVKSEILRRVAELAH